MRLCLQTEVAASPAEVWAGFTEELFLALKPPLMPLRLLRFDGCHQGDLVELSLGPSFMAQRWLSRITEHQDQGPAYHFVDEGEVLPFFLRSWQHSHRLLPHPQGGCIIVDDIEFQAPLGLSALLWPALYLQFAFRKPVYKRVFGAK